VKGVEGRRGEATETGRQRGERREVSERTHALVDLRARAARGHGRKG